MLMMMKDDDASHNGIAIRATCAIDWCGKAAVGVHTRIDMRQMARGRLRQIVAR